jgi:hypothetical protein
MQKLQTAMCVSVHLIDWYFATLWSRVLELCAFIMSSSWAKLCADAEAKPLQALLSGNYIIGGILVRFEFLCAVQNQLHAFCASQ